MRTDRALDVAQEPADLDRDTLVRALVALRLAHVEQARQVDEAAADRLKAARLRRERADVEGRLRSANVLKDETQARVVELLDALDAAAPEVAKRYRAAWGLWP